MTRIAGFSTGEHHAIRSVGQVAGSCAYRVSHRARWFCTYSLRGFSRVGASNYYPGSASSDVSESYVRARLKRLEGTPELAAEAARRADLSRRRAPVVARNPWTDLGFDIVEAEGLRDSLITAYRTAMERMVTRCRSLGGDGVIGVRFTIRRRRNRIDVQAVGTAVRSSDVEVPDDPFTTHLSGQDVAKLMSAGRAPAELVLGCAAMVLHASFHVRRWHRKTWPATEIVSFAEVVTAARRAARHRLREACAHAGANGVMLGEENLRINERRCVREAEDRRGHGHRTEVIMVGTAITCVDGARAPEPLPILRLGRRP